MYFYYFMLQWLGDTVQSNYNFTLSRVITRVHEWQHGKSCRGSRRGNVCPTAVSNPRVSIFMYGNYMGVRVTAVAVCASYIRTCILS